MRKVIIIPIIVIAVIILGFSFIPMLEKYHLYSFDQRVERELGEGQKFTDATGKRCLMSDTIAGDKCPIGSKGYNPDTGVYDTGVSGMAQLNAQLGGYTDPYDPYSFDRIDAMLGITQQQQNSGKVDYTDILPTEIDHTKYSDNPWMQYPRDVLERLINSSQCKVMDNNFKMFVDAYGRLHDDREREKMMLQLVLEYREGLQKSCPRYSTTYNLDSLVGSLLIQEEIREQEYNDLLKQEPEITYADK